MMFEVFGAGFINRGAQLMLRTVIDKLDEHDNVRACIEAEPDSNIDHMAPLGVRLLWPSASRMRPRRIRMHLALSEAIGKLAPDKFCKPFGLVRRQDTDGLIDISGYAFGDKFPAELMRNFVYRAEGYAKRGKPVVLLPQMLGPFQSSEHRALLKRLTEAATRIYAREQASFDAAQEVLGTTDKLRLAPDITIFSRSVDIDASIAGSNRYCCIVPNEKVLQKGDPAWKAQYVDRLVQAATLARELNLDVRLVVHESQGGDKKLAEQIAQQVPGAELFEHEHAGVLKSYIAGSRFLIGSRFHSIVAAFSRGVPAVAIGWAHKYDLLAQDFGMDDLLHNADHDADHLLGFVRELSDDTLNDRRRATLVQKKESLRSANEAMWEDVLHVLGITPNG